MVSPAAAVSIAKFVSFFPAATVEAPTAVEAAPIPTATALPTFAKPAPIREPMFEPDFSASFSPRSYWDLSSDNVAAKSNTPISTHLPLLLTCLLFLLLFLLDSPL